MAKNDQEQKLTETGYRWVTKNKDILKVRSFNFFSEFWKSFIVIHLNDSFVEITVMSLKEDCNDVGKSRVVPFSWMSTP